MNHHPRLASWVGIPNGLKTLSRLGGACLFPDSYHGSRHGLHSCGALRLRFIVAPTEV
jgi:hypothetical protein